jgi:UDP-N-acetylglucosamine 2-epimerase (non-hydrolysing)/GDP/UDP-N,N'-diacetylbacillosamine 2-epimerase (hydrolysing)
MHEIEKYVGQNKGRAIAFKSLGLKRYLSALQYVTAVVGNSSSGIIEVPSFGVPTLNIGDRQKGRIAAGSIIHCGVSFVEICQGLKKTLSDTHVLHSKCCANPYEKSNTVENILKVIREYPIDKLIQKTFHNL